MVNKKLIFGLICCLAFKLAWTTITIHSPLSLHDAFRTQEIEYNIANYGNIPYGTTLAGRVFYFDEFKTGCKPFLNMTLDKEGDPDSDFTPIVLIERGSCTFVRKSRNVQLLGGAVALIMDNQDYGSPTRVPMHDDGTGISITIPTILISKRHGKLIRDEIINTEEENKNVGAIKNYVSIIIDFEMTNIGNKVEYEIWYTSGHYKTINFIKQMRKYNDRLAGQALMTPHIFVRNCTTCHDKILNKQECLPLKNNVYCPQYGVKTKINGSVSLRSGVMELCIFKKYKQENNANMWWDFMEKVYENEDDNLPARQEKALNELGINKNQIDRCVLEDIEEILNFEAKLLVENDIKFNPAIVINDRVYRGNLFPEYVFKAICAGFNETPEACRDDYDEELHKKKEHKGKLTLSTILGLILAILIINLLIVYCYKKYTKKEIKEEMQIQINSVMAQYMALRENKPPISNPENELK